MKSAVLLLYDIFFTFDNANLRNKIYKYPIKMYYLQTKYHNPIQPYRQVPCPEQICLFHGLINQPSVVNKHNISGLSRPKTIQGPNKPTDSLKFIDVDMLTTLGKRASPTPLKALPNCSVIRAPECRVPPQEGRKITSDRQSVQGWSSSLRVTIRCDYCLSCPSLSG